MTCQDFFPKELLILFITTFLLSITAFSQGPEFEVPKKMPPSPTAAAFARYGEIPIDHSTGVPRIEIPLYTIKGRQLSIPLVLSYHAAGHKVEDVSTPVGLGWVISGMGVVSRNVLDKADDEIAKARYKTKEEYDAARSGAITVSQKSTLGSELQDDMMMRDKKSDRYTFTLPGSASGTFTYDFLTGQCVLTPYKPVLVAKSHNTAGEIIEFRITDENGSTYFFSKPTETLQSYTNPQGNQVQYSANTSWSLTKIVSADGKDEIVYEYAPMENSTSIASFSQSVRWKISYACGPFGVGSSGTDYDFYHDSQSIWVNTTHEPLLSRIISANTITEFFYASDRHDIEGSQYRLSTIRVFDQIKNKMVREVSLDNNAYFGGMFPNYDRSGQLQYDQPVDESLRLKLRGVTLWSNGMTDQQFKFDYYEEQTSTLLPPYHTPNYLYQRMPIFAQDFWGYYNGRRENQGLIPSEFLPCDPSYSASCQTQYGGNRRPDPYAPKAYLIKKIHYPTGGYSQFEFEPNVLYGAFIGGFRIWKIWNVPNDSSPEEIKTFKYQAGVFPQVIREKFSYDQPWFYIWTMVNCGGPGTGDIPIIVGASTSSYTQSSSLSSLLVSGAPYIYTYVVEYNGTETVNNGKVEYTYTVPPDPLLDLTEQELQYAHRILGQYYFDNGDFRPQLVSKTTYKIENGTETQVHLVENTYQFFRQNETYASGVQVVKFISETGVIASSPLHPNPFMDYTPPCSEQVQTSMGHPQYINTFIYSNTKALARVSLLTKTVEKNCNEGNCVATTTDYAYENLTHLQPTEKTTYTSEGDILRVVMKYPDDFKLSEPPCGTLVQRNVVTPVIETKKYKGSEQLESFKTVYADFGDNIIAPAAVEFGTGTEPVEPRLRYEDYDDKGNLLTAYQENNIKHAYLWGYNQTYPIAHAMNADSKDIFHTSFEDNGSEHSFAKTGRKTFNGTFSKTLTELTNGDYILSYWLKSGNEWIFNSTTVNVTSNSCPISISGHIDEVRFYPVGTQMVTNTYDVAVGITSQMDANGIVTYYEYDHIGRLQAIRDNNRNILKHFEYKYVQPE